MAPLVIWGLIEQNVVIVAACIPTLRPFFHKVWKGEKSGSGSGSGFKGGSGSGASGSKLSNSTFFSKGRGRGNSHHRRLDDSVLDLDPHERDLEAHALERMGPGGGGDEETGAAMGSRPGESPAEDCDVESDSSQKGIWRTLQVNMEWDAESQTRRVSRFPFVPDMPSDSRCVATLEKEGRKTKHKSANACMTRY